MDIAKKLDQYMAYLMQGLGHADPHAGLTGYCTGLMPPLARKSVEPMAARVDPSHASARHQSLHHFVAKAESTFHTISWREGTNERLKGRVAALTVSCAGGNVGKARLLPALQLRESSATLVTQQD